MSKILIMTNHSYMLYRFRLELIQEMRKAHEVVLSMPFVGHEEDFQALGIRCIQTEVDRRGMNPKTDFRLFLTYRELLKAERPDMVITYHSCGYVTPFITDLMEAGVEVLNPVQPECMDFAEIHAEYGKKLSFWGTVGTQSTMPFGTPDEVKAVVRRNLEIAGEAGGLLCTPTHLLEPEVPWENIEAYVVACREFRLA
mgnify:CR=1 FL=1